MEVGILAPLLAPHADGEFLRALGEGAEAAGARSIWHGEHIVLFDQGGGRVGTPDRSFTVAEGSGLLDLTVALTYLAAHTTTVRLGAGVRILPQANPLYTAKELASIDFVSGGRLDFGIGIGSNPDEFAVVGAPYAGRADRSDEYLALIRTLWTGDAGFDGELWQVPPCSLEPKPVQQPVPVYVGGHSDAAMRRVARHGDGWYGIGRSPVATRERLAVLDTHLAEVGRDRSDVRVVMGAVVDATSVGRLGEYADAGVDEVLVALGRQDRAALAGFLDDLALVVEAGRVR